MSKSVALVKKLTKWYYVNWGKEDTKMYSNKETERIAAVLSWIHNCSNEDALDIYDEIIGLNCMD